VHPLNPQTPFPNRANENNTVLTPAANPALSFPLTSGKAVENSALSTPGSSQVAQLTRRLAAGDEAAFREFHAQYFHRLYRFVLVVTQGQEQEAQEAAQQTLLRVVRYIRVFESEDVFWSWLKTVARSAARDANRKQRRYLALLERFSFQPSKQESHSHEEDLLSAALEETLAELAPQERQLLEAKYINGYTVKDLCLETGMTLKAVESRLERLRRTVRERVLKRLSAP
jgi:RNA polymerase sigma-70 factor, ECF subfamily